MTDPSLTKSRKPRRVTCPQCWWNGTALEFEGGCCATGGRCPRCLSAIKFRKPKGIK
jgi:hypothetical protein